MSAVNPTQSPSPVADPSLRGRLGARREALRKRDPVFLPVPGYEDILQAKYRALDYRQIRRIGLRQTENPDQVESEINVAADTLVTACEGLYEVPEDWDGKPESLSETGHFWGLQAARDLFGIGHEDLPDGASARLSLLRIVPDSTDVVLHYAEYDRKSREVNRGVAKVMQGEYEAGSEEA